jgi:ankyrin repeat protein
MSADTDIQRPSPNPGNRVVEFLLTFWGMACLGVLLLILLGIYAYYLRQPPSLSPEMAAIAGNLRTIEWYLKSSNDVDARYEPGSRTMLHFAAFGGRIEAAEMLLRRGADINALDVDKETPLHKAADEGRHEMIRFLLKNGAKINAMSRGGWTPLDYAAWKGREETAKLLIELGADVNATSVGGRTPLHTAAQCGHAKMVAFLIAKGADEYSIQTAMYAPAVYGYLDVIKVLMANGASVDVNSRNGERPLHGAAFNGQLEAARLLIEKGADVNAPDVTGQTPLHLAVAKTARIERTFESQFRVAELLIDKGADPMIEDNQGQTPLDRAPRYRLKKWSELLGSDDDAPDEKPPSP